MVAPSSLPTSCPRSGLAAAAAGLGAATAAGWVAAEAAAGWVAVAAGLTAWPGVGPVAAAGACVGAAGAGALQAARIETTPAPSPALSSVRREILVPRVSGGFEYISLILSRWCVCYGAGGADTPAN